MIEDYEQKINKRLSELGKKFDNEIYYFTQKNYDYEKHNIGEISISGSGMGKGHRTSLYQGTIPF